MFIYHICFILYMNNQLHKELSKRLRTLITIKNNKGIKSIDISKKMDASFPYISSVVSHLKEQGFVTHTVKGRGKPLHITKKGEQALKNLKHYINNSSFLINRR